MERGLLVMDKTMTPPNCSFGPQKETRAFNFRSMGRAHAGDTGNMSAPKQQILYCSAHMCQRREPTSKKERTLFFASRLGGEWLTTAGGENREKGRDA